jgi:hypothetical protein
VVGARVKRREGEQEGMSMAGMAMARPCVASSSRVFVCCRVRGDKGTEWCRLG